MFGNFLEFVNIKRKSNINLNLNSNTQEKNLLVPDDSLEIQTYPLVHNISNPSSMNAIERIVHLGKLDNKAKALLTNFPSDHALVRTYNNIPKKNCSKDPQKFATLEKSLIDLIHKIEQEIAAEHSTSVNSTTNFSSAT